MLDQTEQIRTGMFQMLAGKTVRVCQINLRFSSFLSGVKSCIAKDKLNHECKRDERFLSETKCTLETLSERLHFCLFLKTLLRDQTITQNAPLPCFCFSSDITASQALQIYEYFCWANCLWRWPQWNFLGPRVFVVLLLIVLPETVRHRVSLSFLTGMDFLGKLV